jgi:hypothetical protein
MPVKDQEERAFASCNNQVEGSSHSAVTGIIGATEAERDRLLGRQEGGQRKDSIPDCNQKQQVEQSSAFKADRLYNEEDQFETSSAFGLQAPDLLGL